MNAVTAYLSSLAALLQPDGASDRVVPPSGNAAKLTLFTAAAMAFLAVFALALSTAAGRIASDWSSALDGAITLRISAPEEEMARQTDTALSVLASTPAVSGARALSADEARALLEPWFGADLPVEELPIPQLIEARTASGFDVDALRLRLSAEVPGAVVDDHSRWRAPLVSAANRLRFLGIASVLVIGATTAAMIALAVGAALSANAQTIRVLRLVGARDSYIAQAFVRRFTLRALGGAAVGTVIALLALALLPSGEDAVLKGLGFRGAGWLLPLLVPLAAAAVALAATRTAALRTLRGFQ